jgi:hypothetical protein
MNKSPFERVEWGVCFHLADEALSQEYPGEQRDDWNSGYIKSRNENAV